MTTEISKRPYRAEDISEFAAILGVPELSAEHTEKLQSRAFGYLVMAAVEPKKFGNKPTSITWPSRSERRKALQNVSKAARKLKEALGNPSLFALGDQQP